MSGERLQFSYPLRFALTATFGAVVGIAIGLSVLGFLALLLAKGRIGADLLYEVSVLAAIAVLFLYLGIIVGRSWYAVFTTYFVDERGVDVRFRSDTEHHLWGSLERGQYRKAFGQLELLFRGATRPVVLTNVDMNWGRASVLMALSLAEEKSGVSIERTWA